MKEENIQIKIKNPEAEKWIKSVTKDPDQLIDAYELASHL